MKVTQWFDVAQTPEKIGAYEVASANGRKWSWWNGEKWLIPHSSPSWARGCAGFDTPMRSRIWRGLIEKP